MPNANDYPELRVKTYASCGCSTRKRTVAWQLIERLDVVNWRGQCRTCKLYTFDEITWYDGPEMERILRLKNK